MNVSFRTREGESELFFLTKCRIIDIVLSIMQADMDTHGKEGVHDRAKRK